MGGTIVRVALALAAMTGGAWGAPASEPIAQAPVPATALRGQNATPEKAPLPPAQERAVELAQLHHAARREVDLGDLARLRGATPEMRRYGAELATRFQSLDDTVMAVASDRGLSEGALNALLVRENVPALRRGAVDLELLAAQHGPAFDRGYWAALVDEQSATADMVARMGAEKKMDPDLNDLLAALGVALDQSSRDALSAAGPDVPR
jgi:hypothetical protein